MSLPDPYLTVAQLAKLWGCSTRQVYALAARREVGFLRIGSLIRFRPEDVQAYEAARSSVPVEAETVVPEPYPALSPPARKLSAFERGQAIGRRLRG